MSNTAPQIQLNTPLDVVRSIYSNFAAGNIPAVLELLSPTVSWRIHGPANYPFFGKYKGREGVQEFLTKLGEAANITRFEPTCFLDAGDKIIVTGSEDATARRSNKSYQTTWCHIFSVTERQVTSFDEYLDTAPIVAAYDAAKA